MNATAMNDPRGLPTFPVFLRLFFCKIPHTMEHVSELERRLRDEAGTELTDDAARQRLEFLCSFCPVYRSVLRRRPKLALWLEHPENLLPFAGATAYTDFWLSDYSPPDEPKARLKSLQRFRRAMSMRLAYRELNGLCHVEESLGELTSLAEFCVRETLNIVRKGLEARLGAPWDEEMNRPARFCVLALGKMGSRELNFVSDLDLIYVFDGRGYCRKGERTLQTTNEEFFSRMARDLTNMLQDRSEEGFLYNIDLRLRPEGSSSPIVRSLAAMEHYYYEAGQTWERLALMKARPVAGDRNLGGEVLETVNAFRFPRAAPAGLFEEIAGVKLRIERENLGAGRLERNIKNGFGGIREIEFIVQALQMVHGGRNPFLQTPSTLAGLAGLERYQILTPEEVDFLRESYFWLRLIEHRLQMREEQQTQLLPEPGPDYDALAASFGMSSAAFTKQLNEMRQSVRERYAERFPLTSREAEIQEWSHFLSGGEPGPEIHSSLRELFWGPLGPVEDGMRRLAHGPSSNVVTREQVFLMMELMRVFPNVLQPLAHPLRTLGRVNTFADQYGARKRFLRMCSQNPTFFRAICLLFDRSQFIHALVCSHPEILEEILFAGILAPSKSGHLIRQEVRSLRGTTDEEVAESLWLYVKAEQVRIAIAQVLSGSEPPTAERALSKLVSVVTNEMLHRCDPEGEVAVVAMGKFGGREMTFGSDLDVMFITHSAGANEGPIGKVKRLLKLLSFKGPLGPTFDIDTRLRPHGKDGPLVVSLPRLRQYHESSAQLWEKQALVRSRCTSDRTPSSKQRDLLKNEFTALRESILFETAPPANLFEEISHMRQRIEMEKARLTPPERAFKVGVGGILDIEFLCQALQLKHGGTVKSLRSPNTRETLRSLTREQIIANQEGVALLDNYNFLRKIEFNLRRQDNRPITEIDEDSDLHHSITKWMGFSSYQEFWDVHSSRMKQTRQIFNQLLQDS